jgi:hypothetical protein
MLIDARACRDGWPVTMVNPSDQEGGVILDEHRPVTGEDTSAQTDIDLTCTQPGQQAFSVAQTPSPPTVDQPMRRASKVIHSGSGGP